MTPSPALHGELAALLPREHQPASAADIDGTLSMLTRVQADLGRLEAVKATLVERLRRQTIAGEDALIDVSDPHARAADRGRRRELARRAVVADLATTLRVGETAAGTLVDHAHALITLAPRMFASLWHGRTSWRHAGILARHIEELTPGQARAIESMVLSDAATMTPTQFTDAVQDARDLVHPVPLDVRHADACTKRGAWLDPASDGMACSRRSCPSWSPTPSTTAWPRPPHACEPTATVVRPPSCVPTS
ncbi:hypothetical protein GCM10009809_23940 [Isoptericola hypogeus]|uniref:DUF222 domain-containing protein n=1 Tax=Isoptericola hypogeus TaxID=300179 RepID=A0ABP4VHZ6_9MICO